MLGHGPISTSPISALPETALEEATKQLQYAAVMAPKDERAAARHIEWALPYFSKHLSWSPKTGGRKPKPKGATDGERYLVLEAQRYPHKKIADMENDRRQREGDRAHVTVDEDLVRKSIDYARQNKLPGK